MRRLNSISSRSTKRVWPSRNHFHIPFHAVRPYHTNLLPSPTRSLATITMAARGQTSYYEILGIESSVSQDAVSKGECLSMLVAHLAAHSSSSIFAPCSYPHQPTARGLCRRILIEEETRPSSRRSQSELG